jgi:3-dehydrocarnitine:acetyl-CoA trimethylamine transferase
MKRQIIVTCAITGGGDTVGKHPAIPVTPTQIASSALEAAEAGAAIVHLHVRDPQSGKPSTEFELYRETVERIRAANGDVIVNLTTGPGARFIPSKDNPAVGGPGTSLMTPAARVDHVVKLKPEICSLDIATMNFGEFAFVNIPEHIRTMARAIAEAGVLPELEAFDVGHLRLALHLLETSAIKPPVFFQICLGVPWGAPATSETMTFMRAMLPKDCAWTGFGIGPQQFPMVAQSVLLGGHARVGLEDNLYLERGVLAPSNAALVEKAVKIVEALDGVPATPDEARKILGLPIKQPAAAKLTA